jgi:hypothetical protein
MSPLRSKMCKYLRRTLPPAIHALSSLPQALGIPGGARRKIMSALQAL